MQSAIVTRKLHVVSMGEVGQRWAVAFYGADNRCRGLSGPILMAGTGGVDVIKHLCLGPVGGVSSEQSW